MLARHLLNFISRMARFPTKMPLTVPLVGNGRPLNGAIPSQLCVTIGGHRKRERGRERDISSPRSSDSDSNTNRSAFESSASSPPRGEHRSKNTSGDVRKRASSSRSDESREYFRKSPPTAMTYSRPKVARRTVRHVSQDTPNHQRASAKPLRIA